MRNNLLKRFISTLIAVAMLFALSACSIVFDSDGTVVTTVVTATTESSTAVEETSEETTEAEETTTVAETTIEETSGETSEEATLDVDGIYTTMEDVALYIHIYGELPHNFMTKNEARALGWEGGSLEPYAPNMCIGGDYFGNYEGLLPEAPGREYHECDINTLGARSRGAERIIFSNDGLIYYTGDHYETFTLLYGEE